MRACVCRHSVSTPFLPLKFSPKHGATVHKRFKSPIRGIQTHPSCSSRDQKTLVQRKHFHIVTGQSKKPFFVSLPHVSQNVTSLSGRRSAACSSTSRRGNTNRTCFTSSRPSLCPSSPSRPPTAWWSSSSCAGGACAKRSDRQASASGRTAAADQKAAGTSRSNGCWVRALYGFTCLCCCAPCYPEGLALIYSHTAWRSSLGVTVCSRCL